MLKDLVLLKVLLNTGDKLVILTLRASFVELSSSCWPLLLLLLHVL